MFEQVLSAKFLVPSAFSGVCRSPENGDGLLATIRTECKGCWEEERLFLIQLNGELPVYIRFPRSCERHP